jgi:hypothetical protein
MSDARPLCAADGGEGSAGGGGGKTLLVGDGAFSARLTDAELLALRTITQERLQGLYLHDNLRLRRGAIEGGAYVYDNRARIVEGSPLLAASDRLFGVVSCARVLESSLVNENEVLAKADRLLRAIPIDSSAPFALEVEAYAQRKDDPYAAADVQAWTAALGRHGHMIGLYKERVERRLASYWLVVHSDAGSVGQELVDKVVKPNLGHITYERLMKRPEYIEAQRYSQRNARRLLRDAALALDLKVIYDDDPNGTVPPFGSTSAEAPEEIAVPTVEAMYARALTHSLIRSPLRQVQHA